MENRRNYYRILQVQPDAPSALIKSTYRALMQTLRMHPDLGGDTWNASLLNEAYAVLSVPNLRKQYDQTVLKKLLTRAHDEENFDPHSAYERSYCLFCKTTFLILPDRPKNNFCVDCHSPLQRIESEQNQAGVRRILERVATNFDVIYRTFWPQVPSAGSAKNFSPEGLAIEARDVFYLGQLLKIESQFLQAIAQVKHRRVINRELGIDCVGVKFLTASFDFPQGTLFKAKV